MSLIPDQSVNAITLRKSFHEVILVLPDSLGKIRCCADVQSAIRFARKDVDAGGFHEGLEDSLYYGTDLAVTWCVRDTGDGFLPRRGTG